MIKRPLFKTKIIDAATYKPRKWYIKLRFSIHEDWDDPYPILGILIRLNGRLFGKTFRLPTWVDTVHNKIFRYE